MNANHVLDDINAAEALAPAHSPDKPATWAADQKHPDGAGSVLSDTYAGSDVLPTEEEQRTLRRVADHIPTAAWLLVVVELCERFSWYGTTGPMTNFIQQPLPPGSVAGNVIKGHTGVAGALGKKQRASTALANFRQFWTYITPIIGAVLADTKWGRFKTIVIFFIICLVGHILLVFISIPSSIAHPTGALGGFVVSLIIMGLGTGGFKSNISPLVAEQYTGKLSKKTLPSGEVVLNDPVLTIQRMFLYYYFAINAGSLISLVTTFAEKDVGFWLAYSLPTFLFLFIIPVLWYGWKFKVYKTTPPRGSVILECFRVFRVAARGKWASNPITLVRNFKRAGFWEPAKPSYYDGGARSEAEEKNKPTVAGGVARPTAITWDDEFVDETYRAVKACKVFLFYPFYWISYDQITSNLTSQAATMELHGVPDEIVNNLNPLSLVIFIPIFERFIYPLLRKWKINFTPIKRITAGFFFGALAMAYSAVLQHYIYKTSFCGNSPSTCQYDNEDPRPAPINVWLQAPPYILIGISEIFASITGLEYAFTKAPERMKSVVMSLFLLQSAFASAIEFALVSVSIDPYLVGMYSGIGVATTIAGILFYWTFMDLDAEEDRLNTIGVNGREGFSDERTL